MSNENRITTLVDRKKTLPTSVQSVIREFRQRLENWYGERLVKLILYGSYARGDYNDNSDIDLLIVLTDEPPSRLQSINELVSLKYDLMIKYGVILSTKAVSTHTLTSGSSAIYQFIRKEGILV